MKVFTKVILAEAVIKKNKNKINAILVLVWIYQVSKVNSMSIKKETHAGQITLLSVNVWRK